MDKPMIDPEEWLISFKDVKRLYIAMKKELFRWALIGGIASYLYFGNADVIYRAEASFKEGAEKSLDGSFFKGLIGGVSAYTSQPETTSLMKSHRVLRSLVEKLGLQILPNKQEWTLARWFRRYRETWRAEKGLLPKENLLFEFSDVSYDGDPFSFYIVFSDPDTFTVFNHKKKKKLALGRLKAPCAFKTVTFTLQKTPKVKLGKFYPFVVNHWAAAAESLKSQITIKHDKDNHSILNLSATDRDRHLAQRIVNELMVQYQHFLKKEYDAIAKEQLAYLEGKQEQILGKMDALFAQHIDYVSRNVEQTGHLGVEEESFSALAPHHQMENKLFAIDVELRRLEEIEGEEKFIPLAEESPFSQSFNRLAQKIQDLKHERDLIELSLAQGGEVGFREHKEELKEVQRKRLFVEKLVQEIDATGKIAVSDFDSNLVPWAGKLTDLEEQKDLREYLKNHARLLSMKEKMLQMSFFYGHGVPKELEGLDSTSAKELFLQYNSKLDASQASLKRLKEFKKEVESPYFDLGSLSAVLSDPLSQKIIAEAAGLQMQLKDELHHSAKEGKRWEKQIALHRKVLADHLEQLVLVEELSAELMREKMAGLKALSLDCIHEQISVLHEQMGDAIKERKKTLLVEREVLQKKMEEIRLGLAKTLPEKWRFEKWLSIKTGMMNKVMETVTEVVESKSMTSHLHHIESKPLDMALLPKTPLSPHLKRMTFLGALVFPCFVFFFALIQNLLKGFPVTEEKLKAIHLPCLGKISPFCDGELMETPSKTDLETLRHMALFSEGAKVIGLIGGHGPDYSYALFENLARKKTKAILVRCDFAAQADGPGIYEVWKGETNELPIRQSKGFDYISSGGYTPFGTEVIQSGRFEELLNCLKQNYDAVFLLLKNSLASVESQGALRLCDRAIITISGERIEELTPFVHWGYDEKYCRISFVVST